MATDAELVAQIRQFGADGTSYAVATRLGEYREKIDYLNARINALQAQLPTPTVEVPVVQVTAEVLNPGPPITLNTQPVNRAAESPLGGNVAGVALPTGPAGEG